MTVAGAQNMEALSALEARVDGLLRRVNHLERTVRQLTGPELASTPIEELDPPIALRTANALKREGAHTARDVSRWSRDELLSTRGIGPRAVDQIEDALEHLDLRLRA